MNNFHDVTLFSGTKPVTTGSRLEIAANVPFLRAVLSSQNLCDGCKENTALVFAEEDEDTLKGTFGHLSHLNSGFQRKFTTFLHEKRDLPGSKSLKKSLPAVQESLASGELTLEGVTAPSLPEDQIRSRIVAATRFEKRLDANVTMSTRTRREDDSEKLREAKKSKQPAETEISSQQSPPPGPGGAAVTTQSTPSTESTLPTLFTQQPTQQPQQPPQAGQADLDRAFKALGLPPPNSPMPRNPNSQPQMRPEGPPQINIRPRQGGMLRPPFQNISGLRPNQQSGFQRKFSTFLLEKRVER